MPYSRPTLTALRTQIAQDIAAALPGTDPLLRFSNLNILGQAQAGLTYLHYGYLDYIALQAVPFTAKDEYLEGWAATKNVFRKAATSASGVATFTGTNGYSIPAGTVLARGDGVEFTSTAAVTVAGGVAAVPATANADPSGLTGAFGNTPVGSALALASPIAGISTNGSVTTAFTGGADLETDGSLSARMMFAFQNPPQGGSMTDFVEWATDVPGVTRAWCKPNRMGPGTVVVFVMLDQTEAAHGGFPQGTNGVATSEPRDIAATGDQLTVANFIYAVQPVTALVYVVSPVANIVNFTISGLANAPASVQAQVSAAISEAFLLYGQLETPFQLSYIEDAIGAVSGTTGFVITSPVGNIANPSGSLPQLGTITYV